MKNTIIILAGILLFGCSAKTAVSKEETNAAVQLVKPEQKNLVSFTISDHPVNTSGWTISRFTTSDEPGKTWLNITTNMHDEKETINININGAVPGTYELNESGAITKTSHGSYYPDYMGDITNSYSFESGSFTILSIDTIQRTLNATFNGTVKNIRGEKLEINNGQIINGQLNTSIQQY